MKKIILAQLALSRVNALEYRSNIPLGIAYLKAYNAEVNVMPRIVSDLLCPQGVIAYLKEQQPDVVGFSLFLWNIEKTLSIASEVKKALPACEFIFGGPEVNADNLLLRETPVFEFGIKGEGERALLRYLRGTKKTSIAGGVYRTGGKLQNWTAALRRRKLTAAFNPYLAGSFDFTPDITLFAETARGCRFNCNFCYYNKNYKDLATTSRNCLKRLFSFAFEHGFKEFFLLDPSFNTQPEFDNLLIFLEKLNRKPQLDVFTELRADFLSEEQIKKLQALNVKEVEVGLQSTNPKALKLMGRGQDLQKFAENAKLLKQYGIAPKVDLIIGLPGDSLATFKTSCQFIKEHGLHDNIQVFQLSVLAGTTFREKAGELGINYQKFPPYYVQHTPTFSREEIEEAFLYAEDIFEIAFDPLPVNFLSTYAGAGSYVQFGEHFKHFHKVVIKHPKSLLPFLPYLTESICLHFIVEDESHLRKIAPLLEDVTEILPFNCFEIIFDLKTLCSPTSIFRIMQKAKVQREHFLNRDASGFMGKDPLISTRFALIMPPSVKKSRMLAEDYSFIDFYYAKNEPTVKDVLPYEEEHLFLRCGQELFSSLEKNECLPEFFVFDDFSLEKLKLQRFDPHARYYRPQILTV